MIYTKTESNVKVVAKMDIEIFVFINHEESINFMMSRSILVVMDLEVFVFCR